MVCISEKNRSGELLPDWEGDVSFADTTDVCLPSIFTIAIPTKKTSPSPITAAVGSGFALRLRNASYCAPTVTQKFTPG